ncbi:uncharacterized protein LOC144151654 isoform X2 [Haemaphysalis longicornis]
MRATTLALFTAAVCALSCGTEAILTFAQYRKALFSLNPAKLKPQCKIVMKTCAPKMLSLVRSLEDLERHWDQFIQVPCVAKLLDGPIPDYSEECSRSGRYGKGIECMRSPEAMEAAGRKDNKLVEEVFKCLLDNSVE